MEGKIFDLEKRTLEFSKRILKMTQALPKNDTNTHFSNQCVRSATSVGANYREANDALGKKDFIHRVRIARKEAKETEYWIELIIEHNKTMESRIKSLQKETYELRNILSVIINKVTKSEVAEI